MGLITAEDEEGIVFIEGEPSICIMERSIVSGKTRITNQRKTNSLLLNHLLKMLFDLLRRLGECADDSHGKQAKEKSGDELIHAIL